MHLMIDAHTAPTPTCSYAANLHTQHNTNKHRGLTELMYIRKISWDEDNLCELDYAMSAFP